MHRASLSCCSLPHQPQVTTLLSKVDEEPEVAPPSPEELAALQAKVRSDAGCSALLPLLLRAAAARHTALQHRRLFRLPLPSPLSRPAAQVSAQGEAVKAAKAAAAAAKEDKSLAKASKDAVGALLKLKEELAKAEEA